MNLQETTEIPDGIGYHPVATESAYTGLDDIKLGECQEQPIPTKL